jgi:hypothetical protein
LIKGILRKFLKPLEISIILVFTVLLVYDYFPNTPLGDTIPKGLFTGLILGLFLYSLLFKKHEDANDKEILNWQIFLTAYILFLIGLFTMLGGQSSSGISFTNISLWIVLLISIVEIISQSKKVKSR